MMNEQERKERIADLVRALERAMEIPTGTDDLDINELMGMYDGKLMALRDMWEELKPLLGLRRDGGDQ